MWERLAVDVTHYGGRKYLTLIDCGPARFTIWKVLNDEGADDISANVETVFREHGAPSELLLDNAASFHSRTFREMCGKWNVDLRYRCAYRPSGNGIVERVHRTIKRMAARTRADVLDMAYYYNISPRDGVKVESVPSNRMCRYSWRLPDSVERERPTTRGNANFGVGQRVYVKPGNTRCTTEWPIGVVTQVVGTNQVAVDGVPRHVADIRAVPRAERAVDSVDSVDAGGDLELAFGDGNDSSTSSEDSEQTLPAVAEDGDDGRRYPRRVSRVPARFDDFVVD